MTDPDAEPGAAAPGAAGPGGPDEDGDEIPVVDVEPTAAPAPARSSASPPAPADRGADWTRADPVRDDPGTLGEEARRLWDSVREQFVDPLLRNYPEAAGHLSTAGSEFAAALRALVRGAERRWTDSGEQHPEDGRGDRTGRDED